MWQSTQVIGTQTKVDPAPGTVPDVRVDGQVM